MNLRRLVRMTWRISCNEIQLEHTNGIVKTLVNPVGVGL